MTEQKPSPKQHIPWRRVGLWATLAALGGYIFWQLLTYWRRLLNQPLLKGVDLPAGVDDAALLEAKAVSIAAANVRAGIEKRRLPDGREKWVLCAGTRNFREPWARDFGFASFGLLELEEITAFKETLELFLLNQRPTGQFPVKIHSTSILDRYLHSLFKREQPIHAPLKPKYITAHNTISLDGNALLVIAALNYAYRAEDHDFARQHWPALKRAITWLESHALEADGLLHQGNFADWADSIARRGRVMYVNILYWRALHDLAEAAARYQWIEDHAYFTSRAAHLKASINDHFWREDLGYYVTNEIFDNLSSSGNLLAIAWDFTTTRQAHAILDNMRDFGMADPVPTQVVHRAYPSKFIAIENRLGGIPDYHTSNAWLWLGGWHIIALARMERLEEAKTLLDRMAAVIVRDGVIHEVYGNDGRYLSTFWYTSEAPLTWSAGMVVHAYYVYRRHLENRPIGGNP